MWQQGWRQHWPIRKCLSSELGLSSPLLRGRCITAFILLWNYQACLATKLLYQLPKLDPNTCSQLGIWKRADNIYYLDQRDFFFFEMDLQMFCGFWTVCLWTFSYSTYFWTWTKNTSEFWGLGLDFPLVLLLRRLSFYCSKKSHLCPAALTLPFPDGHCFSPPLQ